MKWLLLVLLLIGVWVWYVFFRKPEQPHGEDYEGETIAEHHARTQGENAV